MPFSFDALYFILNAIILFIALPIHEFAHAWTADRFGDETPRLNGRLTLNPLAHLDVMGSLMMVVAGFGWAKPVPVNPYALSRHSSSALMWVSLAGPISNFLQAVVGAMAYRLLLNLGGLSGGASQAYILLFLFVQQYIFVNLALMLFNLIPLAPLDGDKVADYLLPPSWARVLENIRPIAPMILLVLILAGNFLGFNILGSILGPPRDLIFQFLTSFP
jgi:Zn-dependent protease